MALQPAAPPGPSAGMTTGPPDFVGIGAQRCGTTRWFELVAAHPQVHAPRKELHFFDGLWEAEPAADVLAAYHDHFPRPPGAIAGEWTPRYMFDFWTPPLLARAAPDARILVSLRDPVERFASGMRFARGRGQSTEGPLWLPNVHHDRGFYARQLQWVFEFISPARVLVLQFERCLADRDGQLARTFEFLGVDPTFRPAETARANAGPAAAPLRADVRRELARSYLPDVRALTRIVPDIDLELWPNFAPPRNTR